MSEARLTSKGRITLPRNIRERLKVRLGDKLSFRVTNKGQIVVAAVMRKTVELRSPQRRKSRKPTTIKTMGAAIGHRFKKQRKASKRLSSRLARRIKSIAGFKLL